MGDAITLFAGNITLVEAPVKDPYAYYCIRREAGSRREPGSTFVRYRRGGSEF